MEPRDAWDTVLIAGPGAVSSPGADGSDCAAPAPDDDPALPGRAFRAPRERRPLAAGVVIASSCPSASKSDGATSRA
ncbi:MAG: hypothetical protein ACK5JG_03865 [Pseudomonadota bacterium]